MQSEVMFAGFGGQGIMISAKILAHAAMNEGREVAWVPSYGPEMRGGTAYCTVVINDELIGSPIIRNPKYLVAMNRPSLEKFAPMVKPNGLILINSSLISIKADRTDVEQLRIPVNDIALKLGNMRTANIVALSALVFKTNIVSNKSLTACVKSEFANKSKMMPLNIASIQAGQEALKTRAVPEC